MKLMIEKISDLQGLYVKELRMLLSAEEMIAIKSMYLVEVAKDSELKELLTRQWQESEAQAAHVREMLARNGGDVSPFKCRVIYGLFDEAEDLAQDAAHDSVRNAALVAVARRIKHYEIALYQTLLQYALALEHEMDARILQESLQEEEKADRQLAAIGERVHPTARRVA